MEEKFVPAAEPAAVQPAPAAPLPVQPTGKKSGNFSVLMLIAGIVLGIYVISLIIPFIWSLLTSFKGRYEFDDNIFGLPQTVFNAFAVRVESGAGFRTVFLEEMFLYSILYAVGCAIAGTTTQMVVAYLCAKYRYKFSKVIYTVVIVVMVLPIVGSLPSELQMANRLGIYDTIWGMYIMKANFLGMYFLVFYANFKALSNEYADAARVDGAGNFRVMISIIFPLVRNTYFTVFLLNFIGFWNDYQTPLIYIPNWPTVAYGLYSTFQSTSGDLSNVPVKLAACLMMLIPILIIFLIFHNRLMGNITVGGLKE